MSGATPDELISSHSRSASPRSPVSAACVMWVGAGVQVQQRQQQVGPAACLPLPTGCTCTQADWTLTGQAATLTMARW